MKRRQPQQRAAPQWLLLCVLLAMLTLVRCVKTKTIDYESLEKAWEAGDEDEELRAEGDEHYRQISEKSDEEAKAVGPQMIFVTLQNDDGRPHEPLVDVASRWKQMLWSGGIEVNIYEVEESKLLVGLQKGIFVKDVQRFLSDQSEVKEYEWNGNTYSTSSMHRHPGWKHKKTRHRNQTKHVKKTNGGSAATTSDKTSRRHKKRKHGKRGQTKTASNDTGTQSKKRQQPGEPREEL